MKYTEQAVETLDDAGSVIANKNIEIEQLRQRVAELEKEPSVESGGEFKTWWEMALHVGAWKNHELDYVHFGSEMAVRAFAIHLLKQRDKEESQLIQTIAKLTAERDELLAAKGKVSVTLTGKEIREIAELAGLQFVEHDYTDEYETEIAIESCPDKGILNDDNAPEHYRLIAFLNEYPEEGCIGLGEKIEAAAIASVKGSTS